LKGQLSVKEKLYGQSAKAAAKAEKVTSLFIALLWIWIAKYVIGVCLTRNLR
jgi:hypothetical protein